MLSSREGSVKQGFKGFGFTATAWGFAECVGKYSLDHVI